MQENQWAQRPLFQALRVALKRKSQVKRESLGFGRPSKAKAQNKREKDKGKSGGALYPIKTTSFFGPQKRTLKVQRE